jgi:prepilin-type N-terminal cleavage/methylation domain-containing protein
MAGFTLVESLVAISILLVALAGPLSIAGEGLALANLSRQQITAIFLAQEVVEFVRNTRDTNILNPPTAWLDGLGACTDGGTCRVDVTTDTVASCPGGVCPALRYHEASGQYGYSTTPGWADTIYTRTVDITQVVSDKEAAVHVSVSWQSGIASKNFTLTEEILNWGS